MYRMSSLVAWSHKRKECTADGDRKSQLVLPMGTLREEVLIVLELEESHLSS